MNQEKVNNISKKETTLMAPKVDSKKDKGGLMEARIPKVKVIGSKGGSKKQMPKSVGTGDAAKVLTQMLNEAQSEVINRKVSRFLSENRVHLKQLETLADLKTRRLMLDLLKEYVLKASMCVPLKIKTHAQNVLVGEIRHSLQKAKSTNPKKVGKD